MRPAQRNWFCAGLVAAILVLSTPAAAQRIFYWVDAKGDLHATQSLANVPEPYYSMYRKEVEAQKDKEKDAKTKPTKRPPARRPPPPRSSTKSQYTEQLRKHDADRKRWKDTVAIWRTRLATHTKRLQQLESEIGAIASNPLMAQTPHVKTKRQELDQELKAIRKKLEEARRMLLEDLPKRAKKEGVPAKWLL